MKCYNDPRLQEALVVQRISTGKVEMTNSVAFAFTLMPLGKIWCQLVVKGDFETEGMQSVMSANGYETNLKI